MIRGAEQESLDIFLVSAVLTVLGIRAYLQATNYPKIGGGGLHIAHVLWGGLGMVIAIGILLSFLSPGTRRFAALIGGVGFGAFIDELGPVRHCRQQLLFQTDRSPRLRGFYRTLPRCPPVAELQKADAERESRQRDRVFEATRLGPSIGGRPGPRVSAPRRRRLAESIVQAAAAGIP